MVPLYGDAPVGVETLGVSNLAVRDRTFKFARQGRGTLCRRIGLPTLSIPTHLWFRSNGKRRRTGKLARHLSHRPRP
ncbi:MAG: hypothetical protein CMJ50_05500 [Planctomycetaceae bacterium]|nr:hypothetical protein [Planctomycetaceae bacterium]